MGHKYSGSVSQMEIPYSVKDGVAYWHERAIEDVDVASFVPLSNVWATDAKSVFVEWRKRRIDRATFRHLNGLFVRDKAHVYDYHGTVDGADAETFECLDSGVTAEPGGVVNSITASGYARDKSAVYYHHQLTGKATAVRGANPATFVSLGNRFGRDDKNVYYEKLRLPDAKVGRWLSLGGHYSTDGERVYYFNRIVPNAKPMEIRVVTLPTFGIFATDGTTYYRGDVPVPETDFDKALSDVVLKLPGVLTAFKKAYCGTGFTLPATPPR